ncbi:unnamed protein product [Nezara viridula]|uniref:Uncharacterized protein n=1 Tax=Nezara viridula TaxID=85310 RepID=A0A9P0GZX2_NEZVI|nr:unnamed protein product [Nezara viridula]
MKENEEIQSFEKWAYWGKGREEVDQGEEEARCFSIIVVQLITCVERVVNTVSRSQIYFRTKSRPEMADGIYENESWVSVRA